MTFRGQKFSLLPVLAVCALVLFHAGIARATSVVYTDRAAFLADTGFGPDPVESFEELLTSGVSGGETDAVSALVLDDFTLSSAMTGTGGSWTIQGVMAVDEDYRNDPMTGRWVSHGDQSVYTAGGRNPSDPVNSVTFDFSATPLNAFGLDIVDFGTYSSGTLTFSNDAGDLEVVDVRPPNNPVGNVQFFGIVIDTTFDKVTFESDAYNDDYAFDALYYGFDVNGPGVNAPPVPEPATACLLALGVGGMLLRRRRSRV